jgi:hypothetical protein
MTTLSCLSHVKRGQDGVRPSAPPALVLLEAVVDRSGSMGSLGNIPANGVMGFITKHQELARLSRTKTLFTLTTFDDIAETPIDGVNLRSWLCPSARDMTVMVSPRGLTRLIDTFMERLHALERRLTHFHRTLPRKARSLNPKIVAILLVVTDGQDNMSETFTAADLNKRVRAAKNKGISVVFMGANQDAIRTAATFGVAAGSALTFSATPQTAAAAFQAATQVTYRSALAGGGHGNSAPPLFSPAQRAASGGVAMPPAHTRGYTQPAALPAPLPFVALPATQQALGRRLGQRGAFGGRRAHSGANAVMAAALPAYFPPPAALTRMQTVAFPQN